MRYSRVTTIVAFAAIFGAAACNRSNTADEVPPETPTPSERQSQQDEATRLEQRVAELEREWNEMEARLAKETAGPTAALKAEVKEDLTRARAAAADLKTTNLENWWDRHERVMENNLADVEEDVKRFARRWMPADPNPEVGTAGTATGWQARRDQLVARLEARLDSMEEALKDIDLRGAPETEVEDTRARVRKLRTDADRLRGASENDWWELSKERVDEYVDRIDRSINRLDDDKT